MFTSNYNLVQHTQQNYDQNLAMDFPYLCTISLCLCTFPPPPSPHITSFHHHLLQQNLNNTFCGQKTQKQKDIFYPHGPKQVLNIFLQRIFTRSAFAEKKVYVMSSPMIIQGAWTRPMPWTTRRKTAKIIFLNYLSSALYLAYTLK